MSDANWPDFFIVGAPKCGTTSMGRYLNQHPEIFVIRGEPHYFGTDIEYNSPRLKKAQYQALVRASGGKPVVGERSTWYLYSRRAAEEIHAANPRARIIAMLRNPAEMMHSLHAHHLQRGRRDDAPTLAAALEREPERRRGRGIPAAARFPESLFYSAIPRYTDQLRRYLQRFGHERVHVIVFDDLVADAPGVYRRALEFLGVDPDFRPDFSVHNVSAPTPDSWLFRRWKSSTLRYRARSLVPETLYTRLRRRRQRKQSAMARSTPRPPLTVETRRRIARSFTEEVDRLESLLERDLSAWRPEDGA
ncbi:MAG: sulfotransferase [Wenzhouxiangellaceae bacterium]|nr:sulfotransferase [Wenzhouxiangellaceae bacterium]